MSDHAGGAWVEINIPASPEQRMRLLLGVVDPLVHGQLADRVDAWFFFWEPELRLRIRWADPGQAGRNRAELARFLDAARAEDKLGEWYEGSHGKRGETYTGEADLYGDEVWDETARDWTSASELALAILRSESEGSPTKTRAFHWQRRVHLFSNQLLLDEISLCLMQAHGYLGTIDPADARIAELRGAIERYLAPPETA
jgi:Lantibiotic biosynthesis dehydratase C-term